MDITGFWWIASFFAVVHLLILIGVTVKKARLKDTMTFLLGMLIALVFELGKALCTIAIIGMFFIRDEEHSDSFTFALVWGIIFFGIGYYFNEKEKK